MKRQTWLYATFFLHSVFIHADPLLVAVLMVKNEEPVMEMTLQPLVDAGITDFLIYDTGSTDNTIKITQDFFIQNNITNFVIAQGKWIDFAISRSKALELTELHFPDATFMLMLDAEWILHNGKELLQFCREEKNSLTLLYYMKVKGVHIELSHPRLMRCNANIRFIGKIHEMPNIVPQEKVPDSIYFELILTDYGQEKSKNRWLHDRDILLQEVQENPNDARNVYYLAQTYFCLRDWQNAAKWYEHRATMSGWDEENFLTVFGLAITYGYLENKEKMVYNFLKAFSMRTTRAEPLIRLSAYYFNIKYYYLSYIFARQACTIPYPADECWLVERYLYEFDRYHLLSCLAYCFQDFQLGKEATLQALKARPDLDYLYDNLQKYQTMLDQNAQKGMQ